MTQGNANAANAANARRDVEGEPQTRVHLHLFDADIRWIDAYFGDTIKRSKFVRTVVRKAIRQIESRMEQSAAKHVAGDAATLSELGD